MRLMTRMAYRMFAGVLVAGLFAAAAAADDTKLKVKEGDKFPDVPLTAAQAEKVPGKKAGDKVSIADLKGKTVVVFFYPKASTKGCTIESCGFRDLAERFPKDVVLIGASNDPEKAQQKFIDENKLPYALLCDTDSKLIKELGILAQGGKAAQRVTFVIDKDGKIAKIYDKVDVNKHPEDVLKFVEGQK
jgi:peroxiredoxin Q/BCP